MMESIKSWMVGIAKCKKWPLGMAKLEIKISRNDW